MLQAQKRVGQLVGALESRGIRSRRGLAAAWAKDPWFLLAELKGWLRKGRGAVLDALWPVLREEARTSPEPSAKRRKKSEKNKKSGKESSKGKWTM